MLIQCFPIPIIISFLHISKISCKEYFYQTDRIFKARFCRSVPLEMDPKSAVSINNNRKAWYYKQCEHSQYFIYLKSLYE